MQLSLAAAHIFEAALFFIRDARTLALSGKKKKNCCVRIVHGVVVWHHLFDGGRLQTNVVVLCARGALVDDGLPPVVTANGPQLGIWRRKKAQR